MRGHLVGLGLISTVIVLVLSGCAGTPKVSQWNAPQNFTVDQVFNAAQRAGTENKFTVINSDKAAGVISMRREEYGGDQKNNERRMSIRVKQAGEKIEVSTKVSGSDFGIIEGLLGGMVHEEITHNFYVYLFRDLNINTNEQHSNVIIRDEH